MFLREITGMYGVVSKMNVTNVENSTRWYEEKLGLINDPRYYVPNTWAQLNCPGLQHFAVGLNVGQPERNETNVVTFVVENIVNCRDRLQELGVEIGEIQDVGKGVKLAYFRDIDNNFLALRQNPSQQPKPKYIGF